MAELGADSTPRFKICTSIAPGQDGSVSAVQCNICLGYFQLENAGAIGCGHTFCHRCLLKLIEKDEKKCPTCRQKIAGTENINLGVTIEKLKQFLECFDCKNCEIPQDTARWCCDCAVVLCRSCEMKDSHIAHTLADYDYNEALKITIRYLINEEVEMKTWLREQESYVDELEKFLIDELFWDIICEMSKRVKVCLERSGIHKEIFGKANKDIQRLYDRKMRKMSRLLGAQFYSIQSMLQTEHAIVSQTENKNVCIVDSDQIVNGAATSVSAEHLQDVAIGRINHTESANDQVKSSTGGRKEGQGNEICNEGSDIPIESKCRDLTALPSMVTCEGIEDDQLCSEKNSEKFKLNKNSSALPDSEKKFLALLRNVLPFREIGEKGSFMKQLASTYQDIKEERGFISPTMAKANRKMIAKNAACAYIGQPWERPDPKFMFHERACQEAWDILDESEPHSEEDEGSVDSAAGSTREENEAIPEDESLDNSLAPSKAINIFDGHPSNSNSDNVKLFENGDICLLPSAQPLLVIACKNQCLLVFSEYRKFLRAIEVPQMLDKIEQMSKGNVESVGEIANLLEQSSRFILVASNKKWLFAMASNQWIHRFNAVTMAYEGLPVKLPCTYPDVSVMRMDSTFVYFLFGTSLICKCTISNCTAASIDETCEKNKLDGLCRELNESMLSVVVQSSSPSYLRCFVPYENHLYITVSPYRHMDDDLQEEDDLKNYLVMVDIYSGEIVGKMTVEPESIPVTSTPKDPLQICTDLINKILFVNDYDYIYALDIDSFEEVKTMNEISKNAKPGELLHDENIIGGVKSAIPENSTSKVGTVKEKEINKSILEEKPRKELLKSLGYLSELHPDFRQARLAATSGKIFGCVYGSEQNRSENMLIYHTYDCFREPTLSNDRKNDCSDTGLHEYEPY